VKVVDTALIYTKSYYRNTLFFNRLSNKFNLELTVTQNENKQFINNGFESRNDKLLKAKLRINITSKIAFLPAYENGTKQLLSDNFTSRNYDFQLSKIIPTIELNLSKSFRMRLEYLIYNALNKKAYGGEEANIQESSIE